MRVIPVGDGPCADPVPVAEDADDGVADVGAVDAAAVVADDAAACLFFHQNQIANTPRAMPPTVNSSLAPGFVQFHPDERRGAGVSVAMG